MNLKEEYNTKLKAEIQKELKVENVMVVPRPIKITVNMGVGKHRDNKAFIKEAIDDITMIAGQKISPRKARDSISNFKLREGQVVGYSVTLRQDRMWIFLEKLIRIVLPRVKDFQGVTKKSFDKNGNYNIGFKEYSVFPEVDVNRISYIKPIQVTINTSAKDDQSAYIMLKLLGMPFRD